MVEKTAAFRQRRVQDTQRWRERLERGAIVLPIEVDGELFDQSESDDDVWAAIRAILEEAAVEAQDRDDEANEEA